VTRRQYDQACSVAGALDRVGERWSLLIVRELLLGPLRFSDLARAVGGAPTDVLTKRLRNMEQDGIVSRRELDPPASAIVYELTELGRGLDPPLIELGRWGLNFYAASDVEGLEPSWLPNSLRVVLQPPDDVAMTVQLRSEGHAFRLRIGAGRIEAERGEAAAPDLTLTGSPRAILGALVVGSGDATEVEIFGDGEAFETLCAAVVLPERLREDARAVIGAAGAGATARTA
jgi:DNA-binding HxlR family transcriptional regulator